MQLRHQELIRHEPEDQPVKTTTLRGQRWKLGVYRMVGRGGVSLGSVYMYWLWFTPPLIFERDGSINWQRQTTEGREWLADREGGYTVEQFEKFMRGFGRGMGRRFIEGTRNLYLHSVTWIQPTGEGE